MENQLEIFDDEMTNRDIERWAQRCIRALISTVTKRGLDSYEINVDDVSVNGVEMGDWSILVERKHRVMVN